MFFNHRTGTAQPLAATRRGDWKARRSDARRLADVFFRLTRAA